MPLNPPPPPPPLLSSASTPPVMLAAEQVYIFQLPMHGIFGSLQGFAHSSFPADVGLSDGGLRGPYLIAYLAALWIWAGGFAFYVEGPLVEFMAKWMANPNSDRAVRWLDLAMLVWVVLMSVGALVTSIAVWMGVVDCAFPPNPSWWPSASRHASM